MITISVVIKCAADDVDAITIIIVAAAVIIRVAISDIQWH